MSATYSNGFGDLGADLPLTFDALKEAQRAIEDAVRARLRAPLPPFVPRLVIDRRRRRAWVEGVEIVRAPVEDGRLYHVVPPRASDGFPHFEREMFVAADPLRIIRRMRRHVARKGHRGRRGAVRVPLFAQP